jgi:hypothetical protein
LQVTGNPGPQPPGTHTVISALPIPDHSSATVTVTVSSSAGTPTGGVNFWVDGDLITSTPAPLNSNGVATFTLTPTGGPGDYALDATYVPTGNFGPSSGHTVLTVTSGNNGGPIVTSLAIQAPTSIQVGNTSARAVVSIIITGDSHAIPTGRVGMSYGPNYNNNAIYWHTIDAAGHFDPFTLYDLPIGTYPLTATYDPQGANFVGSTQTAQLTVTPKGTPIGPIGTSIRIILPTAPVYSGYQYINSDPTIAVIVTADAGSVPQGTVTLSYSGFRNNQKFPHSLVNGRATPEFTLWSLPPGNYTVTAEFLKQNGYGYSTATTAPVQLTVN